MHPLHEDLNDLDAMHLTATQRPREWAKTVAERPELPLWLFSVAMRVAANGLPEAALALLTVLPGIDAGSDGRRELLVELMSSAQAGVHQALTGHSCADSSAHSET